jgi:hypothetical protein
MNPKIIAAIIIVIVAGLTYYFFSKEKMISEPSPNNADTTPDISGLTQQQLDFLADAALLAEGTDVNSGSKSIVNAANLSSLANIGNKAVEAITGQTLEEHGLAVAKNLLGLASDTPAQKVAEKIADLATDPKVLAAAAAPAASAIAGAAAPAAASITGAAAAPSTFAAIGAADVAAGGTVGSTAAAGASLGAIAAGVGLGVIAPIAVIVGIAYASGVFEDQTVKQTYESQQAAKNAPDLGKSSQLTQIGTPSSAGTGAGANTVVIGSTNTSTKPKTTTAKPAVVKPKVVTTTSTKRSSTGTVIEK